MKKFMFELAAKVVVLISGEAGQVKARAEYVNHANAYLIHYKAADGRAVDSWFDEDEIQDSAHGFHHRYGEHGHELPGVHSHALPGAHTHSVSGSHTHTF
ncbi:hypothetical protein [Ewingella americana]|uniref:Uncharacterized protein n=1 Tax=Ewingella americana TaxID=41202 RepID=A0A502GGU3_9GAMM|nr:hypothetical protein [Ewingella americana]TPG61507.1 hypothetical protein EAH77_12765 [Ewingella americana]